MKNKKIVLAGGAGFIGQEMIKYFGKANDIIVLTRNITHTVNNRNHYDSLDAEDLSRVRFVTWDGVTPGAWCKALEGANLLVNLAGQTVNCRYTEANKKKILDSRTYPVKALGAAIRQCANPPELWINASSATIYRHATDHPMDEYNGEFHDDFSVRVCKLWEHTFFNEDTEKTRKVALRMAITLAAGGVLIPYFNLLKFGLGGRQGSGRQMYSWVHVEDTCRMIEWIVAHTELSGTFNCSAPNPVTNSVFMKELRNATGHSFGLPAYQWMLKLGAPLIGTETELVLKSRWVLPTRITETGFTFKFPLLRTALKDIIGRVPRRQYHFL